MEAVHPGEKAQGDLNSLYKYVMGGNKEDGTRLSLELPSEWTRGKGSKLRHIQLFKRKKITFL